MASQELDPGYRLIIHEAAPAVGLSQVLRQERQAALAPEAVRTVEGFLLRERGGVEDFVDLLHALEALAAGGDRKDVVLLARFHEQRPRRDQARDVVHLGPVQNPRHVVVDAVREAHDAVAERVQVAADHRGLDARLERRAKTWCTCRRRKCPCSRRACASSSLRVAMQSIVRITS